MNRMSCVFSFFLVSGFWTLALISPNFAQGAAPEVSSFRETWDVVMDRGYKPHSEMEVSEFEVYARGLLPSYPVSYTSVFGDGDEPLIRDANRTLSERYDYYDRLPKRVHSNGVCVAGLWHIDQETPFTGLLGTGARGLFIGRISVAMGDTEASQKRGFGFAGKVYPSLDKDQALLSANFFTVDVLLGTYLKHALDAAMTNQPETGFSFSLLGLALKIATLFSMADESPNFRPLTQLASAEPADVLPPVQPRWIRLKTESKIKRNNEKDFRREILRGMNENHFLKYSIEVSNKTSDRNSHSGWTPIGSIDLNQAQVSYGCDRRLHFAHPKLK